MKVVQVWVEDHNDGLKYSNKISYASFQMFPVSNFCFCCMMITIFQESIEVSLIIISIILNIVYSLKDFYGDNETGIWAIRHFLS